MTTKVYLRFINENQWVDLCETMQEEVPLEQLDELYVEWAWSDTDHHASSTETMPFGQFVTTVKERWPHSYLYGIDLIISGSYTMGGEVSIPSKQMRQIAQALPYMVEDQLAQDVGNFHLIHGSRGEQGELAVLGIPHILVSATQRLFTQLDLPLDAIIPDMLSLPHKPGEWTLLVDGKHLLIRRSDLGGMAIEIDAVPVVLASILESWEPKPALIRVLLCQEHLNENLQNWIKTQINSALADQEIDVEYDEIASGYFLVICDQLHQAARKSPANLLQGTYAAKGRRRPSGYNWRPLAALVATVVIMYTAYLYTQSWQYNNRYQQVKSEVVTLYKRLFPADRRIVNVKVQMEQHIRSFQKGQGGADFLTLMTLAGQQIQSINQAKDGAIKPQHASYDENQGDLRLDLLVKDFTELENLKNRLQAASLHVETASAAQEAGAVKARLRIRSQQS